MSGDFTAGAAPAGSAETHMAPVPSRLPDEAERTALLQAAGVPEHLHGLMGPHGVAPLGRKMGLHFEEMTPERVVATLPVAGNEQNMGLFHGGAHMVLAETLGSLAAILHVRLTLGLPNAVVGTELGATHHRAVTDGVVTGTCTPITLGRTLTSHEIVMRDEQGRRLSTARMTNIILTPRD
ncbi:hotdog fold thioesterase [Nesterenkonia sp. CL21]|uniref:hotdog fold thioesterase n=1 Tax=Nesterenkonia sp. CL21 TaxID=3064894 RepID=UPI0037C6E04A